MNEHIDRKYRWTYIAAWAATGIAALALFFFSALPPESAKSADGLAVKLIEGLYRSLFSGALSPSAAGWLDRAAGVGLAVCGYALLALLLWNALRLSCRSGFRCVAGSLILSALFAVADTACRVFSGRRPRVSDYLFDCLGALLALICILLCRFLLAKYPRYFNRETISYVMFGVLTTVVNIVTYGVCFNLFGINNLISNAIAWVLSVLFAYVVNKLFVFQSHTETARQALRELGLFIGARVLSFAVDEPGMWLLVDILHVNGGVSKILMNIIVMIMNYFFSKWIIFKKAEPAEN